MEERITKAVTKTRERLEAAVRVMLLSLGYTDSEWVVARRDVCNGVISRLLLTQFRLNCSRNCDPEFGQPRDSQNQS